MMRSAAAAAVVTAAVVTAEAVTAAAVATAADPALYPADSVTHSP